MIINIINKTMFAFLIISCTSCASIIHGTHQEVTIATDPPGAIVCDGTSVFVAPVTLQLKTSQNYNFTIALMGYYPESVQVSRILREGTGLPILLPGGLLLSGIDAMTGAHWKLEPDSLTVPLTPIDIE